MYLNKMISNVPKKCYKSLTDKYLNNIVFLYHINGTILRRFSEINKEKNGKNVRISSYA